MGSLCPRLDGNSRSASAKSPESQDKPPKPNANYPLKRSGVATFTFNNQSKSSIEQCDNLNHRCCTPLFISQNLLQIRRRREVVASSDQFLKIIGILLGMEHNICVNSHFCSQAMLSLALRFYCIFTPSL